MPNSVPKKSAYYDDDDGGDASSSAATGKHRADASDASRNKDSAKSGGGGGGGAVIGANVNQRCVDDAICCERGPSIPTANRFTLHLQFEGEQRLVRRPFQ